MISATHYRLQCHEYRRCWFEGNAGLELARSWNDRRVEERIAANLGVAPVDEQDRVISLNIPDFDAVLVPLRLGPFAISSPASFLTPRG